MLNRNQEIAERIQLRRQFLERRDRGEFTQERVAEKLESSGYPMSPVNLSHYERGRTTIPAEMLEKLAPILGVSIEWFFQDEAPVDDFAMELIASLGGDQPALSQEARDHVLKTIRLLQTR